MLDHEIKAMMLADVPVCVVTSGGLDSSYVTSLAKKYCDNLHSFNISYEGNFPSDERHFAQEVAKACGTQHHQVEIAEKDFPRLLGKMIQHIGQPNSAPHSLSTYALFEAIHQEGFKVALTGEGADEFFSGYKRYSAAAYDANSDWLARYLDKMSVSPRSMREEIYSPAYRAFISEKDTLFDKALREILHYESLENNRLAAVLKFDQTQRFPYYILRRVDHLSMASSVEVRVPFCQPRIIDFSQKLKNNFKVNNAQDKFILYKAAEGKIPTSVLSRPKQPFTLPVVAMLKKGHVLFDMMYSTLNSRTFIERDIFDADKLNLLINRQLSNPEEKAAETLWSLMVFELWLREAA
jgi:asparagine synthase (glutamine-hydrolysing)